MCPHNNLNHEQVVWIGQMRLFAFFLPEVKSSLKNYIWVDTTYLNLSPFKMRRVTGILPKTGFNAKRKEYKFQTWVGNLNIIATSAWKYPIECVLYQTLKCKVNFGPITVSGTKFTRSGFQKSTKELRHIKTIYSVKKVNQISSGSPVPPTMGQFHYGFDHGNGNILSFL